MSDEDITYIAVRVTNTSARALRCQPRGKKAGWVPKSLIHDDSEVWDERHIGQSGKLAIPLWKAEELDWE